MLHNRIRWHAPASPKLGKLFGRIGGHIQGSARVVQVNALVAYYKTFARRIDVHEPWQRGEGLAGARAKAISWSSPSYPGSNMSGWRRSTPTTSPKMLRCMLKDHGTPPRGSPPESKCGVALAANWPGRNWPAAFPALYRPREGQRRRRRSACGQQARGEVARRNVAFAGARWGK